MKKIYLIDDLEKQFSQTSISNLIERLNEYYDKTGKEERIFTVVIPCAGIQSQDEEKRRKIGDFLSVIGNGNECILVDIGIAPYENVDSAVDIILDQIPNAENDEDVRILIDICLVNGDTNRLNDSEDVISIHLFGKLSEKSFLYTQYPANEYLNAWYLKLDELYNNVEPKRIYFRGDIDGEGKFDKDFADKIFGGM